MVRHQADLVLKLIKVMKVKVFDIQWDTDGEEVDNLPSSVIYENCNTDDDFADMLSDEYGWCVLSYKVKIMASYEQEKE